MSAAPIRRFPWFAFALLLLGICGLAAAWISVAAISGAPCAWMAPVAALDAAWLLRLARVAPGNGRMLAGVAATAASIALANWGIVAAQMGVVMGLGFLDSALRLGPSLAWTMVDLASGPAEFAWTAAGLLLALIASR
ncbi:hypothetical protein [Lysobacter sp. CFH 32150]|uniref:hypothetical protein n=1 Tax=Lysobacter sp. CFH 32150 TaxID=2927128 RepID=UPI001FA6E1FC|nr:hypothetical protein [Lysobacter sp. CFH 32150]MCI4567886.1 hypothetical protein [Lysobacter sp. CFH 32150]